MKKKVITTATALALGLSLVAPQAFAATELEQDLINTYEMQEVLDKDTEEVNKIRRNTEEKPSDKEDKPSDKDEEKDKPSEGENKPKDDDKKPSDKEQDKNPEDKFDPNKGFDKKEDAIKEAEKIIKDSKINKGYDISKGADGKYYIALKPEENKTIDKKEIKNTKETKDGKEGNKKAENKETNKEKAVPKKNSNTNVKTGITPLTGVISALIASVGAFSYSKKENK